jgi:hypothetical protein
MSLSSFHVFWWTEHEFPPGFLPNQRNFPAKFIPKHESHQQDAYQSMSAQPDPYQSMNTQQIT